MAAPTALNHLAPSPATSASNFRARKRKSDDVEAEEKPRGRPRKHSKDESAAERRRTQIRLAQRAYRQRKEATIDELRQKVNELTGALETVDRSLRDFTANARHRGLPPQTAQDLELILQQLARSVASANSAPKAGSPDDTDNERDETVVPKAEPTFLIDNNFGLQENEILHPATRPSGFVVEEGYNDDHLQSRSAPSQVPSHQTYAQNQHYQQQAQHQKQNQHQRGYTSPHMFEHQQPQNSLSMLNAGLYNSTMMQHSRTITPLQVDCDYERSFARRLQRISIEAGYVLLRDPSKAPNAYQRVFRLFISTGRNPTELTPRFALAMRKGLNDSLDSHDSPFAFIGGAGLHYQDTSGCRRTEVGSHEDRAALDVMASSIPGLGGEWLDTHDVQGLLHEYGIPVDGQSMFVHASLPASFLSTPPDRVEVDGYLAQTSRYHTFEDVEDFNTRFLHLDEQIERQEALLAAERQQAAVLQQQQAQQQQPSSAPASFNLSALGNMWAPTQQNLDLGSLTDFMDTSAPHFFSIPGTASYVEDRSSSTSTAESATFSPPLGKADSVSSTEDEQQMPRSFAKPAAAAATSAPRKPERVTVTVDVCKLLKVLLLSSTCLGRAPGFRRWHVEAAIRSSVITGF